MLKPYVVSIFVITVSCALNWYFRFLNLNTVWSGSKRYSVIIGILSSQENFEYRNAIRKSWMKLERENVKSVFIIGKEFCLVPPEDRIDSHTCMQWKPDISQMLKEKEFSTLNSVTSKNCTFQPVFPGFSFKVHFRLIIRRIGARKDVLLPQESVTVILLDALTKEVLTKTTISLESGSSHEGFVFRNVENLILPKGFEGILMIQGNILLNTCSAFKWSNGSSFLSFSRIYSSNEDFNTIPFNEMEYVALTAHFSVYDSDELQTFHEKEQERRASWDAHVEETKQKLVRESRTWNDIHFVNAVDVYRNIPLKLLQFLSSIAFHYSFDYVLKTDDDCYIDLIQVLNSLKNMSREKLWWSRFRKNWVVNYYGKWKDWDYSSALYPAFACGAGYVLSKDLVQWLSSNAEVLHPYQGEDISMGIWLAPLKPNIHDDTRWSCDSKCVSTSLNRAELSVENIEKIWKQHISTGNICSRLNVSSENVIK